MSWWRWLPVVAGVVVVSIWALHGGHTGWTRDSEFLETLDPVTGLTKLEESERWVPGLDYLAVWLTGIGAVALGTALPWKRIFGKE